MKAVRKAATFAAIGALSVGTFYGASALVQNVKFAHAEDQVEATREQLKSIQDLSTVYREVGKVVEPSVVMIKVEKSVRGTRHLNLSPDMLKKFFPDRDGDGQPDLPDGLKAQPNGGANEGDDNGDPSDGGEILEQGEGSGVIMEVSGGTGFILTNNHVAGGATKMVVTLADGREITDVKLVGADAKSDLAVIKINADKLIAAKWGDSDYLEKGDLICAFGSPFGFVGSMTHGIVSALNRDHVNVNSSPFAYESFIQVDAPINPGNSGGPLVNMHGEVVGINTAIATNTGSFNGIGFAIPSDSAKAVYEQLKSTGKIVRGWLGVEIANVGDAKLHDMIAATGFKDTAGVFVSKIMNGTPAFGVLQPGDIITAIDGKPVKNVTQLRNQIALTKPKTEVKFSVFRNGKTDDATVTLGEQPENLMALAGMSNGGRMKQNGGNGATSANTLGMRLSSPTDQLLQRYGLGDDAKGAVVTMVTPNSDAANAGIAPGDLITKIGETEVTSSKDASDALSAAKLADGVRLLVTNKEGQRFVFIRSAK